MACLAGPLVNGDYAQGQHWVLEAGSLQAEMALGDCDGGVGYSNRLTRAGTDNSEEEAAVKFGEVTQKSRT